MMKGRDIPVLSVFLVFFVLCGCRTTKNSASQTAVNAEKESLQEIQSALGTVAGAVRGGEQLTEEELKALAHDVRTDPEAQSAIEVITGAVSQPSQRVKYSPATGKRYGPNLTVDPETGVPLEWVEE